jgi:hypothetical protein
MWRIVPLETATPGRRCGALAAEDARGRTAAVAHFDGPATGTGRVELSLQLGPARPAVEIVGRLVRSIAALAIDSGADRMTVTFDPRCQLAHDVMAASGLDWHVSRNGDAACAEVGLADTGVDAPFHEARSTSVVRTHPKGVTVLPSAEGPSPRSDPRWSAPHARRSERLLERLVTRR